MKAVKYQKKSLIKLEDLLKRRRSSLKTFLKERGISNFVTLQQVCQRLGVTPPSAETFDAIMPSYVSDPSAGVIVVPPLDVVLEQTGERKDMDDSFEDLSPMMAQTQETSNEEPKAASKRRQKKQETHE